MVRSAFLAITLLPKRQSYNRIFVTFYNFLEVSTNLG